MQKLKWEPTDWSKLTVACCEAMRQAEEKPGRFGGRYVARKIEKKDGIGRTVFLVLEDDDPDLYRDDEDLDILAQCLPNVVNAIGGARRYLQSDGRVVF